MRAAVVRISCWRILCVRLIAIPAVSFVRTADTGSGSASPGKLQEKRAETLVYDNQIALVVS